MVNSYLLKVALIQQQRKNPCIAFHYPIHLYNCMQAIFESELQPSVG